MRLSGSRSTSPDSWDPLLDGLAALPEELRQTILLRDVEGLSCEAIAACLGCSVSTVKFRINQARLQLYRTLRRNDPDLFSSPAQTLLRQSPGNAP